MKNYNFILKHNLATMLSSFKGQNANQVNRSLMFHSIADSDFLYSLPLEKFKSFINILEKSKLPLVPFTSNQKGISITFDDGLLDKFTVVAPLLLVKKIPFTIFMITDFINSFHRDYLNANHLKDLADNPLVTIGTHGKTHTPLATLGPKEAQDEMRASKLDLENILSREVTTMSFPHGSFNREILRLAKEVGYKKCGTSIALPNKEDDNFQVNRQCIYSCESNLSFNQKINGKWDWIWGNSNN
jgi:peptidoglycan/xylan/chitin deacetylase (PgdA/CDA1 family)